MNFYSKVLLNTAVRATVLLTTQVAAQTPPMISDRDATEVVTLHAEGAQLYECKPDPGDKPEAGALTWQFREPIATLIRDGKSVGRHYAGPNWDYFDGSAVKGKVAASAPGATSNDIPWLKIEIVDHRNGGILSNVTAIRRINTRGGLAQGSCERAGDFLSIPYSADYVFLRGGM
jgi:Protein of unknown function (DUF3455)